MNPETPRPRGDDENEYGEPTDEELAQVRAASAAEAAAVDAMILGACARRWRKVAMIVGTATNEFEAKFPHLPFVYMQVRMQELEERGGIEVQGDVMTMRHSERACEQSWAKRAKSSSLMMAQASRCFRSVLPKSVPISVSFPANWKSYELRRFSVLATATG